LKTITDKLKKGEGIVGDLLQDGPLSTDLRKAVLSLKKCRRKYESCHSGFASDA